jgi:hypothetical protein
MNNFIVDKNSFHYKLNYFMKTQIGNIDKRQFEYRLPSDFCSYWRMTFVSAFWLIIFVVVIVLLTTALVVQVATNPVMSLIVVGILLLFIGLVFSSIYSYDYLKTLAENRRIRKEKNNIPDGIVATKYKSWKQRYCPRVEYK